MGHPAKPGYEEYCTCDSLSLERAEGLLAKLHNVKAKLARSNMFPSTSQCKG